MSLTIKKSVGKVSPTKKKVAGIKKVPKDTKKTPDFAGVLAVSSAYPTEDFSVNVTSYETLTEKDRKILFSMPLPSDFEGEVTGVAENGEFDKSIWKTLTWKQYSKFSRDQHCRTFLVFYDE